MARIGKRRRAIEVADMKVSVRRKKYETQWELLFVL